MWHLPLFLTILNYTYSNTAESNSIVSFAEWIVKTFVCQRIAYLPCNLSSLELFCLFQCRKTYIIQITYLKKKEWKKWAKFFRSFTSDYLLCLSNLQRTICWTTFFITIYLNKWRNMHIDQNWGWREMRVKMKIARNCSGKYSVFRE